MSKVRPLHLHPACEAIPAADEATVEALAADIAANGQHNPITVYDDGETRWVVDGRTRLEACRRAGVEPVTAPYDGDPARIEAWAIAENVKRRHLTVGQRACIAAEHLLPRFEAEARGRQDAARRRSGGGNPATTTGKARDLAAAEVGVSARAVADAKRLRAEAPDAFADVRSGAVILAAAVRELSPTAVERKVRAAFDELEFLMAAEPDPVALVDGMAETLSAAELAAFGRTMGGIAWWLAEGIGQAEGRPAVEVWAEVAPDATPPPPPHWLSQANA